jgi:HK97 gp10 family phage protein
MAVRYESRANEVKNVMAELERAALKEVAKFLRPLVKQAVPVDEGVLRKNVGTWVRKKDTVLQIGVYTRERAKRKGYKYAYHASLVHFGTKRTRAVPYLRDPVMQNIDQIRLIEGKYLKEIENENRARGLIQEEEEIADD